MNSAPLTFDRLAYIDRLMSGGVEEQQARVHAAALATALRDSVATKSDVDNLGIDLRGEIREVEVKLEAKIETAVAGAKIDVLRWLVVTQAALGGFIFTALKFVH